MQLTVSNCSSSSFCTKETKETKRKRKRKKKLNVRADSGLSELYTIATLRGIKGERDQTQQRYSTMTSSTANLQLHNGISPRPSIVPISFLALYIDRLPFSTDSHVFPQGLFPSILAVLTQAHFSIGVCCLYLPLLQRR